MRHSMKLNPEPFYAMKSGYKTVELRLLDEKRRAVKVGDEIEFARTDCPEERICKRVKALHVYPDFSALFRKISLLSCGFTPFTFRTVKENFMDSYYSPQEQEKLGVVGIELEAETLQRFISGSDGLIPDCAGFEQAMEEVRRGRKSSHWIWYIFPQLKGLTGDRVTEYYGLRGAGEAEQFYSHPILGERLRKITSAILEIPCDDPVVVFGETDAYKLRNCMTLFSALHPEEECFAAALEKFCMGDPDPDTLRILRRSL